MGTTAEKLTYLNTTKQKIKDGLNDLGAELTENDTFRSYANVLVDIYDELPKVSDEGTDLELNNTKKGKLAITPKGNSSQFSTEGTNIIGLTTEQCKVSLTAGDKITMTNQTASRMDIRLFTNYGDTNHNDYWRVDANSSRTITVAYNSKAIAWDRNATGGLSWGNLGETALPYELYTDGPAPNPNYSFMPSRVTGENSVEICNVNLFDKNTVTNNYYLDDTGAPISSGSRGYSDYIPILPNTTYTLSGVSNIGGAASRCYYDKNKNFISGISYNQTNPFTNTSPANAYYMRESFYKASIDTTQVEKGSTAPSTYVPHEEQNYQLSLGDIELNSSPDETVRDEIRGTLDNWFKREYIGKKVFDGSEEWSVGGVGTNPYIIAINGLKSSTSSGSNPSYVYCNYFRGISYNDRATGGDNIVYSVAGTPASLYFRNTTFANLTSWENFLQEKYNNGNPVIAIYVKSSYTDIPITDTTLINQLNDMYYNAHSYNGTTNITSTYEDGNEQMVLDASALKSWHDSNE